MTFNQEVLHKQTNKRETEIEYIQSILHTLCLGDSLYVGSCGEENKRT